MARRAAWPGFVIVAFLLSAFAAHAQGNPAAPAKNFEFVLSAHGHIQAFTYPQRGPDNWIDAIVGLEAEIVRYQRTFLVFRFENETDMGHSDAPLKAFDPNRGRWMFGLSSRTEFQAHFLEVILRHDCFHGIDRYFPGQDYKMNSAGVAFGSAEYLEKNRFRNYRESAASVEFPLLFNYGLAAAVFVPRGGFWQRSPYSGRFEADFRFDAVRWKRLGLGVESINVFDATDSAGVQRSHEIDVNLFLYGESHAMRAFFAWWPHDGQLFRNRDGRTVAGVEVSF
jgi:hypothetical protein